MRRGDPVLVELPRDLGEAPAARVDRRVVPSVHTVKTPWGQRLIPVAELERFPPQARRAAAGAR